MSFIEKINNKSINGWEELYATYYQGLCVYVNRIINNLDQSQDIVQELLISLWKSTSTFNDVQQLRSFLYKSCYNNALVFLRNDQIRSSIRNKLTIEWSREEYAEFQISMIQEELLRRIYCQIKELPDRSREVIELSLQGYSGEEIAQKMNISINTVKTLKSRSFKILRQKCSDTLYLLFLLFPKL